MKSIKQIHESVMPWADAFHSFTVTVLIVGSLGVIGHSYYTQWQAEDKQANLKPFSQYPGEQDYVEPAIGVLTPLQAERTSTAGNLQTTTQAYELQTAKHTPQLQGSTSEN